MAREMGADIGPGGDDGDVFDPDGPMDDGNPMGTPEAELTLAVDVTGFVDRKRAALAAHRSQVTDPSFFLQMPPDMFARRSAASGSSSTTARPGPTARDSAGCSTEAYRDPYRCRRRHRSLVRACHGNARIRVRVHHNV